MPSHEIAIQRMLNQRISGEKFNQPEDVVRWMGALQAQDYQQALWAVGLRTQTPTVNAVTQAVADGKIIQTWPMRGTLHFVPPEDVKWMLRLSASRQIAADTRRMKQLELDEDTLGRCRTLFYTVLQGGKRLSRPEMMQMLENAGISPQGQRGYHILWRLSQEGFLCPGPMQDKQQTFVLLDEWVSHFRDLSREASLAELATRYFASHGLATLQDFARWAGITLSDAKMGIHEAGHSLISETINDKTYWRTENALAGDASGIYLLPGFDEYLIGYGDRSDVLPVEHSSKIVPGGNGIFFPTIILDGQVIGTWKRTLRKNALSITLHPFEKLNMSQESLIAAAKPYSDFIGLPVSTVEISAA